MKNLPILTILLIGALAWSQDRPIRADVVFLDTLTTTEIGNLTTRPSQGALVFNSTVDSLQVWNGNKWTSLGSGTYTFSTGLTNTSGTITVTNPFEQTDEDKLDGIPAGATVGADWDTNLINIPADIADGDDDTIADGSETKLSAGTNISISGTGTTGSPYVINSTGVATGDNLGNHTATQSLDMADNNIVDVGTINATSADLATIETSGITSVGDVTIDGANLIVGGYGSFNSFILNPTDTEPTLGSRRVYWDLSENRLKGYNGSNWVGFALQSDLATAGTDDQTASEVTITDSGGNFTATDVEGALAELAAGSGSGLSASDLGTTSKTLTQSDFNKFNYSESNLYLKVNNSITTDSRAAFQPLNINSFMVVTPDTGIAFVGNTVPPTGFYVDSLNIGGLFKLASNLYSVNGYVKPYSISQVTGVASSNIAETSFDIDWDAATASVGTISDYQYSIDGSTPVDVTGATGATVSGLTASTTYNVNVRAVDAGGNKGQYSADLSVTTASSFTPLWAANAATPTPNEVAGFAGFIDASNYSVGTVTSPVTNGTNAISITRTADGNSSADIGLQFQNLTIGQSYDFTFSIQITSGSPNNNYVRTNGTYAADWSVTGLVEYGTGNVGNWETYTLTMTPAVTNPRMRFNSSALVGVNTNGMVTLFDNLIVTPN